jgi:hypothetical protein
MVAELRWLGQDVLEIEDVRFLVTEDPQRMYEYQSSEREFVLLKDRSIIEALLGATADMSIRRILEFGIFKGGSVVLNQKLFRPEKLVAVDLGKGPEAEALDRYIAGAGLGDVLRTQYGLDQGDRATVTALLEREFPARDIDLVIDDASHLYGVTKASFNAAIPYVRPGGLYIIEDWSWAQSSHEAFQKPDGIWHDELALTNLVFEMVLLCGSRPDIVADVRVNHNSCYIRRGPAQHLPPDFDISTSYLTRGRPFVPTL